MSDKPDKTSFADARSTSPDVWCERIAEFVLYWSSSERSKTLRCSFFCLFHVNAEGEREPVTTDELPSKLADDQARRAAAEKVARRLVDEAVTIASEAREGGRLARFNVSAYTSTREDASPPGQMKFNLDAAGDVVSGLTESDDGSAAAMTAQSMRHTENFARLHANSVERNADRMERLFGRVLERLERAESLNDRLVEQREQLLDRRLERQLTFRRGTIEIERDELLQKMLFQYGGALASKWLGLPSQHPLVNFLDKLDAQTLQNIVAQLPADRQAELAKLMQELHASTATSAPKLTNGNGGAS